MKIDYDQSTDPPAPFIPITIAHPMISTSDVQVAAKIDSGADITALPINVVQQLNLQTNHFLEVAGYDNQIVSLPVYDVRLTVAHIRVRLKAIAVSENHAILGRDVLNLLRLMLDGPALTLEVFD